MEKNCKRKKSNSLTKKAVTLVAAVSLLGSFAIQHSTTASVSV